MYLSTPVRASACLLAVVSCSSLSAVVTLIDNNASNESWVTAADWSDGLAVTAGGDYSTDGYTLRSPNTPTWASTFPAGATLTVEDGTGASGGIFLIKSGVLNMDNVNLGLGGLVASNPNNGTNLATTWNVTNLTVLAASTTTSGESAAIKGSYTGNDITMNVTNLLGSGYLAIGGDGGGLLLNYTLNVSDASGFTGILHLDRGNLILSSGLTISSGSFMMSDGTNTLDFGGYDMVVSSFEFGATSLSANTYTSAELNTLLSTDVFSGVGSLTVIPEPATTTIALGLAVLVLGAGRISIKRRRK
ncbi:hypothetical protein [Coraliomargarita parva]|uniref:hypothetical protein n=1 Tax=Coraliomargarita parva TaxID=3014050 RepID=UPI0022B5B9B6|nr:hypothetical protein [Coraliomargarita parva]